MLTISTKQGRDASEQCDVKGFSMASISGIRLVWFPIENPVGSAKPLYVSLTSQEPDRTSSNRQPSPQQPVLESAGGRWNEFDLEVQVQHGRVDLVVQPVRSEVAIDVPDPPLADANDAIVQVLGAVKGAGWLPAANRLSAISTIVSPSADIATARAGFCAYIGYELGIPDASDHFFQVNRRESLGGMLCNRVVQVSVTEFQTFQINTVAGGVVQNAVKSTHALLVNLDFNTVPISGAIDQEDQKAIFESLFAESIRAVNRSNISFLKDK